MKAYYFSLIILQSINSSYLVCHWNKSGLSAMLWTNPFIRGSPLLVAPDKASNCWVNLLRHMESESASSFLKITALRALQDLAPETTDSDMVLFADSVSQAQEVIDVIANLKLGRSSNVIIFTTKTKENMTLNTDRISLDQRVFMMDLSAMTMFEAYTINGLAIWNNVGCYQNQRNKSYSFAFNAKWTTSHARTNFYGTPLTIITEHSPPYSILNPDFKAEAPFIESNQTYDVTGLTSGFYHDIVSELASDLNFTIKAFKQKVENWGSEIDGKPTGMLSFLADGSADILVADFAMTFPRSKYAKYMPILTPILYAIAVKDGIEVEEFGIDTFTSPLSPNLWLSIFFFSTVFAVILFLMNNSKDMLRNPCLAKAIGFLNWLWTSITGNFGVPPMYTDLKNSWISNRIVFLSCILSGFIAWMAYQAALTSALATIKVQPPFDSLETLLKTDFQLSI